MVKKLVLSASLAALASGSAFAEELPNVQTSVVSSSGGASDVRVDQRGGEEGLSFVTQIGSHSAVVRQSDTGSGPSSTFSEAANISHIEQVGSGGAATVIQSGLAQAPANRSAIVQNAGGIDGDGAGVTARVVQANAANASDIYQAGDALSARVFQRGEASRSVISQGGTGLSATVNQNASTEGLSDIQQTGSDNAATVVQSDTNGGPSYRFSVAANQVTAVQTGSGATARIVQRGNAQAAANLANTAQTGTDGVLTVLQSGSGNLAYIVDEGIQNAFDLRQFGTDNTARADFSDLALGTAGRMRQLGTDGTASATIDSRNSSFEMIQNGAANAMTLNQGGQFNTNAMRQFGDDNIMSLDQHGTNNVALMVQNGRDNAMSLTQTGDGNSAVLRQIGVAAETIDVTQTGGQTVTVTRRGAAAN